MERDKSSDSDHLGAPDPEGRAVVLLHGAGGGKEIWEGVQRQLAAAGIPALALDLPGHGGSRLPLPGDVHGFASAVADRLAQLKVARAVVVGHSLGGAVALRMAVQARIQVIGLGIVSSGARLPVSEAILQGLLEKFPATAGRMSKAALGKTAPLELRSAMEEMIALAGPARLHADFSACARFSMAAEELAQIACPVAVICGEEDRLTPKALSEELVASVRGASLALLPAVGHMAMLESVSETAVALGGLWERATRT